MFFAEKSCSRSDASHFGKDKTESHLKTEDAVLGFLRIELIKEKYIRNLVVRQIMAKPRGLKQ